MAASLSAPSVPPAPPCKERCDRVWALLKHGILDPEDHKDAWLIDRKEMDEKRGSYAHVLHPKWRCCPDVYFYHDSSEGKDVLVVMDRRPETVTSMGGRPKLYGVHRDQVCCCDETLPPASRCRVDVDGDLKLYIPLLNRGDCSASPLPMMTGVVV